jgi:hypothetical protein
MTNPNFNGDAKAQDDWIFEIADWIKSTSASCLFLIDHHMRITARWKCEDGVRWYQIFDTTLERGFADYKWVLAAELEKHCQRFRRPPAYAIPGILARVPYCQNVPYSVKDCQDCESIQRWIETGQEKYRFSTQVWSYVAIVGFAFVHGITQSSKPKPRRKRLTVRKS